MSAKAKIISQAEQDNAQWPQYKGHWRGDEWVLVKIKRRIRTKLGVAFEKGDVTIAKRDESVEHKGFFTAYSLRNKIDTSVPENAVEVHHGE
jgi:hypothetical protein